MTPRNPAPTDRVPFVAGLLTDDNNPHRPDPEERDDGQGEV
jgi:hypothetical protein